MIDLNWDLEEPSRSTYDKAENYHQLTQTHWSRLFGHVASR